MFEQDEYAVMGPDLGIDGLRFGTRRPTGLPSLLNRVWRGHEEALETLLLLHFETFFNVAPVRIACSRPMASEQDLVALDALGRIHLVEAKEGSFDVAAFDQAMQYALRYIFYDSKTDLFGPERQPSCDVQEWLAQRIAGLWAGTRSEVLGRGKKGKQLVKTDPRLGERLRESFGREKWGPKGWERLGPEGRARVYYEFARSIARQDLKAAGERTERKRVTFPAFETLWEVAGRWRDRPLPIGRSAAQAPDDECILDASRPLVLWLIGRAFNEDVLARVREMRALGMDVRPQIINFRSEPGTERWFVHRQREHFPQRDELERRLCGELRTLDAGAVEKRSLNLSLYRVKTPSEKRNAEHGTPLPRVVARFRTGGAARRVEVGDGADLN